MLFRWLLNELFRCLTMFLCVGFLSAWVDVAVAADSWSDKIQKLVDKKYLVSLAAARVSPTGVQTDFFGSIRRGQKCPPDINTVYELGSITKTFTAITLAQMVVNGSVTLNDPVERHVIELKDTSVGKATLVQLATHTSGLPSIPDHMGATDILNPYANFTCEMMLNYLTSLEIEDGSHPHRYSNLGFGLLGLVLMRVDGQKNYIDILRKYVLDPLDMNDTTIDVGSDQQQHLAVPYNICFQQVTPWSLQSAMQACGALRSTLGDLIKYAQANLNPSSTPIGKAIELSHEANFQDPEGSARGLAWGIDKERNIFGHGGATGGFSSYLYMNKKEGTADIFLTNTDGGFHEIGLSMFSDIDPFAVEVDIETLSSYVGQFHSTNNLITFDIKRVGGHLIGKFVSEGEMDYNEWRYFRNISQSSFLLDGIINVNFLNPTRFTFTRDNDVRVFRRSDEQ